MAPKRTVILEEVSNRLRKELIHPNRDSVLWGLRFLPDGKRVIGGDYPGGVVVVWDIGSGKQLRAVETGMGFRAWIDYFHVSADGRMLYAANRDKGSATVVEKAGKRLARMEYRGLVRAWNLQDGRLARTYQHDPPLGVQRLNLSGDGRRFVALSQPPGLWERRPQRVATIWETQSGASRLLPVGAGPTFLFTPDGKTLLTQSTDENSFTIALKSFDATTGREMHSVPIAEKHAWLDLKELSPDGKLLISTLQEYDDPKTRSLARSTLQMRDARTGTEIERIGGGRDTTFGKCGFTPDGRVLAVTATEGNRRLLLLYNVAARHLEHRIELAVTAPGTICPIPELGFRPDGRVVAVPTQVVPQALDDSEDPRDWPQPKIHLIDVAAGKVIETIVSPQASNWSAAFSPDGRTLVTGGIGRALLWDVSDL